MSIPGIGDPYWYEWYVGLENIIDMLNVDNEIEYVIFQKDLYDTIDDVVVGYKKRVEYCYQVKHEIGSDKRYSLTFDKLIKEKQSREHKKANLIQSLAKGWKDANQADSISIVPILYTNRTLGINKTNRVYKENEYKALPLAEFIIKIQERLNNVDNAKNMHFADEDLNFQYQEFCDAIDLDDVSLTAFLKTIKIRSQMYSLGKFENLMLAKLQKYFNCTSELAGVLFRNLTSQLRIWTTTRRNNEKVTIEDVYDALALKQEYENISQHQLVAPSPFFDSRKKFIDEISKTIYESDKKVVFLSGEPGCGKTSIISYMQNNYDCFVARYHTFRPISPEQRFYNADEGLCSQEALWGELMNQLRVKLKGQLLKYRVPVNNALCEIGRIRSEVLRILEKIYMSNGKKVYVCIDGIDHAARSKLSVNFLASLFQPDEIPEGVCFIIVGQPEEMYQNYPVWLSKDNPKILYIKIPRLCIEDIKQLLANKIISHEFQNDGLARAIFEKTQGNNLSVVFAVEEIRKSKNVDAALHFLDLSHVSGDVEQYYIHIWDYLKNKIREFGLSINFPDVTIASAILLLNGRIRVDLLSEALKDINLNSEEWSYIFDCLYPVIEKSEKDDMYFIFHNDFRVFLMGVVKKNQAKYRELSYKMALYFINDSEEILEKYVNTIPLLNCAGKSFMIPNVFTTEFVIGALANGVSRNMLADCAQQAYQNVCQNKNWNELHKVYLAISTLKQHYSYFEYYDMQYVVQDISNIQQIKSFEIVNKKFSDDTLDEFSEVLEFINRLIKDGGDKHYNRIVTTYDLWFGNLTPLQAIQKLLDEVEALNIVWRTNEIIKFMQKWGKASAFLDKYQYLPEEIPEGEGSNELLEFNDTFFDYYFYEEDYQKAIDFVKKANITYKCVESKIFKMMEDNTINLYIELIQTIESSKRDGVLNRLAKVLCMLHGESEYNITDISSYSDITYILDDTTFEIVVNSILEGVRDQRNDIDIVCEHVLNKIKIEQKEYNKNNISYLKIMLRVCIVIGRHMFTKADLNECEKRMVEVFMQSHVRRTFDFSKAYKTIIYCLCNMDIIDASFVNNGFSTLVKGALFQYANIGQYCKTIFLDYLCRKNYFEIIKEYFLKLYGDDGSDLFLQDQYVDLFYHYYDYAKEVIPELCDEIKKKIKWNIVGYTGHKEYALNGPQIVLEELLKNNPELWEKEGVQLYNLSNIADISSGNGISGRIEDTISEAAIRSGIKEYWQWHHYDSEIAYPLHTLYSQIFYMVAQATNATQLLDIWLYSCGIQSWYRQDDRIGIKSVYFQCRQKAEEIEYTLFENDCRKYTPSYLDICLHEETNPKYTASSDSFNENWKKEREEAIMEINELPTEDLVDSIIYQDDGNHSWKKISRSIERLQEEGMLSTKNANSILEATIQKLSQYEWEHYGCSEVLE
ncbi:ATP-binding protein [Clostridium botulinum]|uniref:ATP-binding protein n=1 Tax=Clostridium botulinum TaxID=1491 RepID=A0A6G4CKB9_CLOBO|nr:ATP-binding protein [Clostridium botulinum]NEZ98019.1 ATP-binding protein [Clostridium botulinum]NFA30745.1 ATP-binding protein [Clostridium botulinum]NFA83830.1 ATP-binding protein [Clostridium botulinum]NFB07673.1 ATP-binding protein [Clostridium botulinum]